MKNKHFLSVTELVNSEFPELSRHNGFDARLCYGDVTLAFRFFPNGLPESCAPQQVSEPPQMASSSSKTSLTDSRTGSVGENARIEPLDNPHPLKENSGRSSPLLDLLCRFFFTFFKV